MVDEASQKNNDSEHVRKIDWKQGLMIALGVPLLILPSIGYTASYLWAAAIVLWGLSVVQGFLQNFAYGELATAFPKASGLPGFAQQVFGVNKGRSKYDLGKFIGGFSAWSYWFAWNPVLAIFSLLVGAYLQGLVPGLEQVDSVVLSLIAGTIIFSALILINFQGLVNGARAGLVLAIASMVPLMVITLAPFATKSFHIENITTNVLPADWSWDMEHILTLLGLFGIAQWSACAWETAAIYGPQYKSPGTDIPRALFICGIVCLFTFVFIQASVTGTLGVDGILAEPISPLLPMAQITFGDAGALFVILILITAMILIIQTAYLGSAVAMQSMAQEGNLPSFLQKLNSRGVPVRAMIVIGTLNLLLITLRIPTAILAASAIGYTCANGISLFAYWKARTSPEFSRLERPFKAPRGWKTVAMVFGLFNMPLCLVGILYLNGLEYGSMAIFVGIVILAAYVPIWIYTQGKNHKTAEMLTALEVSVRRDSQS